MKNQPQRSKSTPKSYRVREIYKIFLEACYEIYCNKSELLLNLMKAEKVIDANKIESIPIYKKFPLLEKMLDDLKTQNQPIKNLRYLNSETKVFNLLTYYNQRFDTLNSVLVQTRIFPEYKEFIEKFSPGRLGEALELAVANFINNTNDFEYELIEFQVKLLIDKA